MDKEGEIKLSTIQECKFKILYAMSLAPLWQREYYDGHFTCGISWHMTRIYGNGDKAITSGYDQYPFIVPLTHPYVLYLMRGLIS